MPPCCSKCYCPDHLGHNVGCPDHPEAGLNDQKDFDRGYAKGFNDLSDEPQVLTGNKSYDLGFRAGRDLIDSLADDAAQSRCFG